MNNIKDLICYAAGVLHNVATPALEARLLLLHNFRLFLDETITYEFLFLYSDKNLDDLGVDIVSFVSQYVSFVDRRHAFEPIAYIIGYKEFYGYKIFVNEHVLIPRADTEVIVDKILHDLKDLALQQSSSETDFCKHSILDMCTGSGCISIALAMEVAKLQSNITCDILASDISADAINVMKQNLQFYGIQNVFTACGSWFDVINSNMLFDIIVVNPPYISSFDIDLVAQETLLFEPDLALFADKNGLECYSIIAENAKKFLTENGKIYLEIGINQEQDVKDIFSLYYNHIDTIKDLSDMVRGLVFKVAPSRCMVK